MGFLATAQGYGATSTRFLMSVRARRLPISAQTRRSETMGSRRSKQSKRRSARAAARTHLGRLARASPPLASCSHQPPSPPSSPTPTCTQHTAAAQDSIQETPTDPRGESAAQRFVKRTRSRRRRRRIGRPVDPAETRRRCLTDAGAPERRGPYECRGRRRR